MIRTPSPTETWWERGLCEKEYLSGSPLISPSQMSAFVQTASPSFPRLLCLMWCIEKQNCPTTKRVRRVFEGPGRSSED